MKTLLLSCLVALGLPMTANAQQYTSSKDASPPYSDALYYNGKYYSTACRQWDDDGDGVNNCHDFCPETPTGDVVGFKGCTQPRNLSIAPVHFDFNSARITYKNAPALNDALLALFEYPDLPVTVVGHTDSVGSARYNQRLSERRAWAVRNYLTKRGISSPRVDVAGHGEMDPDFSNRTYEGRAFNRRAVFDFDH